MEEWHKSKTGVRKLGDWGALNTSVLWDIGCRRVVGERVVRNLVPKER